MEATSPAEALEDKTGELAAIRLSSPTYLRLTSFLRPGELTAGQAPPSTLRHDKDVGKAEARRAQIQHRQRKANYAKGLERDIVRLRGGIERCRADCWTLAGENQGMRQQLAAAAAAAGPPPPQLPLDFGRVDHHHPVMTPEVNFGTMATQLGGDAIANPLSQPPRDYGGYALAVGTTAPLSSFDFGPDYMAYLDVDGNLGSLAFQVTRAATSDQEDPVGFNESLRAPGLLLGEEEDRRWLAAKGSGEETDKVINFILA